VKFCQPSLDDRPFDLRHKQIMEIVFAYLAGLLTLINPCVLPVLPIVLASGLQTNRHAPAAIAAGMSLTFVVFGILVVTFGRSIGLSEERLLTSGSVMMILFGMVMLVPKAATRFELATAGMSQAADSRINLLDQSGLGGQFLGGALLGMVWSPCIGPTLGGAIALASQGESLPWATLILTAFAIGVSSVILALGYGARSVLQQNQALLRRIATKSHAILGLVFVAVGLALLLRLHRVLETWAVENLPIWLINLSVSL
jgi:cytochrome c-type biogenesis protein